MECKCSVKLALAILTLIALGLALAGVFYRFPRKPLAKSLADVVVDTVCVKVLSGDTIETTAGDNIRLIGVRVPEATAKQATAYSEKVLEGKQIRLKFEEENKSISHKDDQGRLLAYVYLKLSPEFEYSAVRDRWLFKEDEDGVWLFFNAAIIAAGYACTDIRQPFAFLSQFAEIEGRADRGDLFQEKVLGVEGEQD